MIPYLVAGLAGLAVGALAVVLWNRKVARRGLAASVVRLVRTENQRASTRTDNEIAEIKRTHAARLEVELERKRKEMENDPAISAILDDAIASVAYPPPER